MFLPVYRDVGKVSADEFIHETVHTAVGNLRGIAVMCVVVKGVDLIREHEW